MGHGAGLEMLPPTHTHEPSLRTTSLMAAMTCTLSHVHTPSMHTIGTRWTRSPLQHANDSAHALHYPGYLLSPPHNSTNPSPTPASAIEHMPARDGTMHLLDARLTMPCEPRPAATTPRQAARCTARIPALPTRHCATRLGFCPTHAPIWQAPPPRADGMPKTPKTPIAPGGGRTRQKKLGCDPGVFEPLVFCYPPQVLTLGGG